MILRIIDKETGLFIRDDFNFDDDKEIGLEVEPAQGFYHPKWDFENEKWTEGGDKPESKPKQPSAGERIDSLENTVLTLMMED